MAAQADTILAGTDARVGGWPIAPIPVDRGSICIVIQDFALGGTERVALRLARAWADAGRSVTLFCGESDGPLHALIAGAPLRVVTAQIKRGRGSIQRLGKAAARFLRAQPHDACFIPGNYHWKAIPPIAALPLSIRPHLLAQLSSPVSKPQRRGLRKFGFRLKMRRCLGEVDAIVTLAATQSVEVAEVLPDIPVYAIALPAVPEEASAPTEASGRTIVAAGRLVEQKAFQDLIAAFALLDDTEARLVIVGEGPKRAALEKQIADLGLQDRVSLPGFAADIRPYLDDARLFVLSSHYEGYGAVIVEALAAGRPVVATNCTPANAELLSDERFGRTVPIDSPSALAEAIAEVLASPVPDPALLADAVRHHGIAPVARAYLALFDGERQLSLVRA